MSPLTSSGPHVIPQQRGGGEERRGPSLQLWGPKCCQVPIPLTCPSLSLPPHPAALQETFTSLGFEVRSFPLLTMEGLTQQLGQVAYRTAHHDKDSFVCVLVSRGGAQSLLGVDGARSGLPLERIRSMFRGDACPSLLGKPKLFFIQTYEQAERPAPDSSLPEADGPAASSLVAQAWRPEPCTVHPEADFFWSLCTADVALLERHPTLPSRYLQGLAQKLRQER